jgi:hypothetical protein
MWRGEIPFEFGKEGNNPVIQTAVKTYNLPVVERTVQYVGKK